MFKADASRQAWFYTRPRHFCRERTPACRVKSFTGGSRENQPVLADQCLRALSFQTCLAIAGADPE
jgi:hypothetical protein